MTRSRLVLPWDWSLPVIFTLAVNLLVLLTPMGSLWRIIAGAAWLLILPGSLLLRILKLGIRNFWERLAFTATFSVLTVMVTALVVNTLLPLLGNSHPLAVEPLLVGLDVTVLALMIVAHIRDPQWRFTINRSPRISYPQISTVLAGLVLVTLSVLGAICLNNGGPGILTMIMLVLASVYLSVLIWRREHLPETAILTGIYSVALSLLLMTSLRGWFITGHDVQHEFHVFSITLSQLHWSPGNYIDAYNACLSITILPTVVRQITGINELLVYKTIFQALFALVPPLVYLIARRYHDRLVSLLAAVYFVAFPTYFSDMPMLNRQEIAFLFMAVIFLVAFNKSWSLNKRRLLICLLGLGVVLSHYSTTYIMLGLFGMVIVLRYVLSGITAIRSRKHPLQRRVRTRWSRPTPISLLVVIVLFGASYLWSAKLTNTGTNLAAVAGQTIASIEHGVSGDTKSSDTDYSLVGGAKLTDQQRLEDYVRITVPALRAAVSADEPLYSAASYSGYQIKAAPLANLPLTPLGHWFSSLGLPVSVFNDLVRQGSAFFLQLALLAGVALMFTARSVYRRLSDDYRLFQLASVFMLGAVVVLPVLSAQYGLLRAFQQVLMLSGATIAVATIFFIPSRFVRARVFVPALLAIGFFVSSTGIITTALGGYPAQLQLANAGSYYDLYYTHATERQAADWLTQDIQQHPQFAPIAASIDPTGYVFDQLSQLPAVTVSQNLVYPGVIPTNAFVFLGYTATVNHQAVIPDNGDLLPYQYNTSFLDANKDLIYSNGGAKIYR